MQRLTTTPNVFNVRHHDYKLNSNGMRLIAGEFDYYRFVIYPTWPSVQYSVQNHNLAFRDTSISYKSLGIFGDVRVERKNYFSVQAVIANNYHKALSFFKVRNSASTPLQPNFLVVDFCKEHFDGAACLASPPNTKLSGDFNKSMMITSLSLDNGEVEVQCDSTMPYLVYYHTATIDVWPYGKYNGLQQTVELSQNAPRKDRWFVDENGQTWLPLKIFDYGKDKDNHDLGQDIVIDYVARTNTVGYQREIEGKVDWCSNIQPRINKKSYLGLTKQLDDTTGNAAHIAELFADYVNKGTGFSAFIYGHWARHTKNIEKAKIIYKELSSDEFKDASNLQIADFLATQYEELSNELKKENKEINPNGSFARRINYAILQLTNGLCHSVGEFRKYQSQLDQIQNAQTFSKT